MTIQKIQDTSPRRVKVYTLDNDKWIDQGTGYCIGQVLNDIPKFIVRNENSDTISEPLLNCSINGNIQFQRQQDTLIVWTGNDGIDYALSFQEIDGCIEICDFICSIQKLGLAKDISLIAIIQTNEGEITEIIAGPIPELKEPIYNIENLTNILDVLMISKFKSKFIDLILKNNSKWLSNLLNVFVSCEINKDFNKIYIINDIIRTLVYFNEISIFELLINDQFVNNIVGILEYDPDFPDMKMDWRNLLNEKIKIKYVFQINNEIIKDKIREVVILKFFKDVVLARLIDDSIFNTIGAIIQNKETEIIEWIVSNDSCLENLFNLYEISENNEELYDGIKLVNQFVQIAKNFNFCKREIFYKSLINSGLLKMIHFTLNKAKNDMKLLIMEVIVALIEHDTGLFKFESNESLLKLLTNVLLNDSSLGLKSQAFEAIKLLIDPTNSVDNDNQNDNDEKDFNLDESFLRNFYNNNATLLFKPLALFPENFNYDKPNSLALENLCELVSFISKFHNPIYSRSFILENGLLDGISRVVNNQNIRLQIRLSAARCLRNIIILNDQFYARYIINNELLTPLINLYDTYHTQENLVTATCLNIFNLLADPDAGVNVHLIRDDILRKHADTLRLSQITFTTSEPSESLDTDTETDTDHHHQLHVVTPQKREKENMPTSAAKKAKVSE